MTAMSSLTGAVKGALTLQLRHHWLGPNMQGGNRQAVVRIQENASALARASSVRYVEVKCVKGPIQYGQHIVTALSVCDWCMHAGQSRAGQCKGGL